MGVQVGWIWLLVTVALLSLWCSDFSFALPIGTKANPTQEEIDKVTAEHAKEWMLKYSMAKRGQTVNLTNEIAKIQLRAGINITGKLDDETKRLFLIPRCGVPESEDAQQEHGSKRRKKRFTLQGSDWQKKDLTFRFLSSTEDLPVDVQQNILRRMISKWEKASTLTIREADPSVSDDDVEILISFVRRFHGDPYPFDGPGGTLAHAYYPHNNRGLSGDAHFDDDEDFTTGTPDGINLDWVAVHEFGHSMGLEHSNVRESIMYPWYKGYFENIELTSDDIKGIQALYGAPTPTPAETTTEAPTTQPDTTTKATTTETPTTQPDTTTKASTTEAPTTQPATTTKASTTETPTTQPDTTTKATTTETPTTQPETTTKASTTEAPTTQPATTTKASTTETPTTQPDTTTKASTTEAPTTQPATTTKASTTETPTTQPDTTTKATTTETPTTQPETTTKASTTEAPTTQPATTTKASTTETPTTQPDTTTKASTTETPTTQPATTTKASTTDPPTTQPDTTTKVTTKATTQISTERPTTPLPVLEICRVEKFDAFVMGIDRKTYVFSGDYFWVLGVRLDVESGPTKITSKWKELRTPIDSAYTNWDGRFVFFKGYQYWKYFDQRLEEGPRDISKLGLPSDLHDLDAAFIWEGNYRTYFFKGDDYWRYNENYKSVDAGYPKHISIWGLPHPINSAMSWSGNRRTYFFRDADYWKLDDGTLTLVSGYPRDITKIWMSCPT